MVQHHSPSVTDSQEVGVPRDEEKRLKELCELTSKEQDPDKLVEFVAEMNVLWEAKEDRLKGNASTSHKRIQELRSALANEQDSHKRVEMSRELLGILGYAQAQAANRKVDK
jgi:hypothetical protein